MFKLTRNFDAEMLKEAHLHKSSAYFENAFEPSPKYLEDFLETLLDPQQGAYGAFPNQASLVRIFNQKSSVDPRSWSHSFPGDRAYYRDIGSVMEAIKLKSSIVFEQYYRYHDYVKDTVAWIESYFKCNSGCNAYLSQRDGVAFPTHRDTHHVLVFALSGIKKWNIYKMKQDYILAHHKIDPVFSEDEIHQYGIESELVMNSGDILYIPIGQFHSVQNLSNNAFHLTFAMSFKPMLSIVENLLQFIYSNDRENQIPEGALELLNQIHPVHLEDDNPAEEQLISSVALLFDAFKILLKNPQIIKKEAEIPSNYHLKALAKGSKELIRELL